VPDLPSPLRHVLAPGDGVDRLRVDRDREGGGPYLAADLLLVTSRSGMPARPSAVAAGSTASTRTTPRRVLNPLRRQARRKLLASAWRWKPSRSAPSRPSMIRRRQGSWANSSYGGNGMWLKNPIRRSGRSRRSCCGVTCSW
jgi:hypothetical protein